MSEDPSRVSPARARLSFVLNNGDSKNSTLAGKHLRDCRLKNQMNSKSNELSRTRAIFTGVCLLDISNLANRRIIRFIKPQFMKDAGVWAIDALVILEFAQEEI